MYQRITLTPQDLVEFSKQEIVGLYVEAVRTAFKYDEFDKLQVFKSLYPQEYKDFVRRTRARSVIRHCIKAMKFDSSQIYWGTLTFNNRKNLNKIKTKREEAFKKLNSVFKYVVLVEEYGEDNGRYHIHFLGVFKSELNFNDFRKSWHSRQELRLLEDTNDISKYLVKYLTKEVPRIRKNKNLVGLVKRYEEHVKQFTYQHRESTTRVQTFIELCDYINNVR